MQDRYGPIDRLEVRDVDAPTVGDDEVLVRVRAASVHPDVWHFLTGRPYAFRLMGSGLRRPKQRIPGTDIAGTVEATGPEVTEFAPGDDVFGETNVTGDWSTGGGYAEFVAIRRDQLRTKPVDVTFEQAASVPTSGFIALTNLRGAQDALPDRRVLVNGAGGGVGSLALQIAKAYGAHVTAVDSASKAELLRTLGADRVIDYASVDFTQTDEQYDLIFDVPGNRSFSEIKRALADDGRYVLIGHEGFGARGGRLLGVIPQFFRYVIMSRFVKQLRGPGLPFPTRSDAIEELRALLEIGAISPVIDSVYRLEEVREALRHMTEDELLGKVIIKP